MKTFVALFFLFCLFHMPQARAQCANGIPEAGNPECLPPDDPNSPYYQGSNGQSNGHMPPPRPVVRWADRWGAVAIDSGTSSVGISENQTEKSAASAEALQRCASKSDSQHCELELAYYNQCAALAWGTKYFGKGRGETRAQAENLAMQSCKEGASDCKVVYTACSLPVRIQ